MPSNLRRAVRNFVASPVKEEKSYRRIDEPGLVLDLAALLERNSLHAKSQGLPAIGSKLLNPHGLEFVVEGHVHVPTANTIQSWRDGKGNAPTDLYPSIIPQNLSPKLMEFIETIDRCTTKTLLVLDTMPYQRKDSGVPGGHWIDTLGNSGANLLFIDAASIHETHLAHEIGHLWIQYVDQAEDERVLEDASDPARNNQLSFVQSFVLDFRVNEIIERKGFDMTVIRDDENQAIASLGRAIHAGYSPDNKREEVFMALTLATHLVESRQDKLLAQADSILERLSQLNPEFLELANKFAEAVKKSGFRDRESIRASIDACLSIAFLHTGDGIDLDKDLVIPPIQEPDFDKFPKWMEGASTDFKCEVGRLMAREGVPNESNWILSPNTDQTCLVSFKLSNGDILGPWTLNHPYPISPKADRLREINEINRQNRERQMKQTRQENSPLDHMAGQPRRFYMAGTGRFLTRVREEEWLNGESAYGYAENNPVTYTDPSGLQAKDVPGNCYTYACDLPVTHPGRPGQRSGTIDWKKLNTNCKYLIDMAKRDKAIIDVDKKGNCPKGYHRVIFYKSPPSSFAKDGDFHVIRQDNDGTWSDKHGPAPVQPGCRHLKDPDGHAGFLPTIPGRLPSPGYERCPGVFCAKTAIPKSK